MRKIKMSTISAGPDGCFHLNETYEEGRNITTETIDKFLNCGACVVVQEFISGSGDVEKAVVSAPETAGKGKGQAVAKNAAVADSSEKSSGQATPWS